MLLWLDKTLSTSNKIRSTLSQKPKTWSPHHPSCCRSYSDHTCSLRLEMEKLLYERIQERYYRTQIVFLCNLSHKLPQHSSCTPAITSLPSCMHVTKYEQWWDNVCIFITTWFPITIDYTFREGSMIVVNNKAMLLAGQSQSSFSHWSSCGVK